MAATVSLNGEKIGYGTKLLFRPGEKLFLESFYGNDPQSGKLFVFDTYRVDGDIHTQRAIQENGNIKITVYEPESSTVQLIKDIPWNFTGSMHNRDMNLRSFTPPKPSYGDMMCYTSNCSYDGDNISINSAGNVGLGTTSPEAHLNVEGDIEYTNDAMEDLQDLSVKTGRIEAGGNSDQRFQSVNDNTNWIIYQTFNFKILPKSEIHKYVKNPPQNCTGCGTRKKVATWKHCPTCGTRYINTY
jgi:hypothetical protein